VTTREKVSFDYIGHGVVGEVKRGLRSVTALRASFMQLAVFLAEHQETRGFIVLDDPVISDDRLREEWAGYTRAVLPEVAQRLSLIKHVEREYQGWPQRPDADLLEHVRRALGPGQRTRGVTLPRADCQSMVLIVLLENLLSGAEAELLTVKSVCQRAGCSYPSVALALGKLDSVLRRTPQRGVALRGFPVPQWRALVLESRKVRSSRYYQDRSGQPRRPADLLQRVAAMRLEHVAVGGVPAASAWYPGLDIAGNPRLDLCVHAPGKQVDLGFVQALDPALQETDDPSAPAHLALHFTRSKASYYAELSPGLSRAGRVDSLLDLHDLRFDQQADEWLDAMLEGVMPEGRGR
jgi:hypothetical protein